MIVNIPFNAWSRSRLKQCIKVCTSRNRKYGEPGDTFMVDGKHYEIKLVLNLQLWFVRDFLYSLEGAESPDEFENVWKGIYYGRFDANKYVWTHFFPNVGVL